MNMRILIVIALILVPGLSFAQTDCRVVELSDNFEVVCTGDEKASVTPDTPSAAAFQHGQPQQQAAPEQIQAAEMPQTAAAAMPPPQSSQSQVSQGTVVHRQGRQQYQKGMEEARVARLQLIYELQQRQPAP